MVPLVDIEQYLAWCPHVCVFELDVGVLSYGASHMDRSGICYSVGWSRSDDASCRHMPSKMM